MLRIRPVFFRCIRHLHGDKCGETYRALSPEAKKLELRRVSKAASEIDLFGHSHLPFVSGLSAAEKVRLHDGREIVVLLPKMLYRKKRPRLENVVWEDESHSNPFVYPPRTPRDRAFSAGLKAITEECLHGAEYYFENGLRFVKPYFYVFDIFFYKMHKPQPILKEIHQLFPFSYVDYFKYRMKKGYISLNFEPVDESSVIDSGDILSHLVHYHEHPVLDLPIEIIYEDSELLVVNKPPSMVVYPTGPFRCNSLKFILAKEFGYKDLRPLHRIDKITSGVCIFTKGPNITERFQKNFNDRRKEYLALVDGEFPEGEVIHETVLEGFKANSFRFRKFTAPKDSKTIFRRLEFNGKTSLVHCIPLTGRTHQIRIHLQQLGFPIVNDNLYNPLDERPAIKGDNKAFEKAFDRIVHGNENTSAGEKSVASDWMENLQRNVLPHRDCIECQMPAKPEKYRKEQMFMCLHSWRYQLDDEHPVFEANLPRWATDPKFIDCVYEARAKGKEVLEPSYM